MAIEIPIESLSTQEKIVLIERLWESLAQSPREIPSPQWHVEELAARQVKLQSGESKPIPWEQAKRASLEYGK